MKARFGVAAILAIAILAAPRASAQQMASYHCVATSVTPGASHVTVYVSQLIPMEANQRVAISGAWATYIKANYHLEATSTTYCQPLSTNPAMQEQVLTAEENVWKTQGWEVVQVTWKPGQAASSASAESLYSAAPGPGGVAPPPTAATPAPAPTQPGGPSASYCFSDVRKPTIYFSDAFDTADVPSSAPYSSAFTKFLAQKYKYIGAVTCKTTDTIFNAQNMYRDQRDTLQNKQIVETDWTYEAPAPGEAAAAPAAPAPAASAGVTHTATSHNATSHTAVVASAPPPPPAAAAPAPHAATASGAAHHYYCVSKPGQVITYFSAAFDSAETDARIISGRYDAFLQTQYQRKSNGLWSCPDLPSQAAARADLQKQIDALRTTNQQVIETGWTYAAP
ncbi:MAG TPA: hypothetical protein VN822_00710 [Candidatus Acidoferrales bacterium]|nr:hypothetical protein [Candidatus Acidoferrales bacterium]